MEKKKLLITGYIPEYLIAPYREKFDITMPDEKKDRFTTDEVKALLPGQDALFTIYAFRFQKELIELAKDVKVVLNYGVGYDNIDVPCCTEHNIFVVNTPTTVTEPTAEMTFAIMVAAAKGVARYDKAVRETRSTTWPLFYDRDILLYGKTLGIVGYGRIGQALGCKAQGLGMNVIYYDPFRRSEDFEKEANVTYASFDEVLSTADVISCHMPYTPENHHVFNKDAFRKMKSTAYFVNAARGPIMCEADLVWALENHIIRGAALDVYEFEPNISEALTKLDNVVLTPHVGSNVIEARANMLAEALNGSYAILTGGTCQNIVNKAQLGR